MRWSLWMCRLIIGFLFVSSSFLISTSTSTSTSSFYNSSLCHPHDSSALLHFKHSFSIFNPPHYYYDYGCDDNIRESKTVSWKNGTNCCTWSGVTCDKVTGNVIQLNLHCSQLHGIIHSNSTLFFLPRLRSLDLSFNNFSGSQISANFGRFTSMRHLNLSYSFFVGQVPPEIFHLSELLSLDLSYNSELKLETSSLQRITTNLTNLKELSLRWVNMFFAEPGHSLMNLSSSLTSLDLSESGLHGKIPEKVFLLPNLQVLDLSSNENLTGSFPKSNWSSPIRELALSWSSFSIDISYLARNLKFLNGLYLCHCKFIGSHPPIVMLANLSKITSLDLSENNFVGHIPWNIFLNLRQLTSLDLSSNNFVGHLPETCANNSNQVSLLCGSSEHQFVGPVPMNLQNLRLSFNKLNETIPSWLYSLPVLETLDLSSNEFIGTIQDVQYGSLGFLNLENLYLSSNKLNGALPSWLYSLPVLRALDLSDNQFIGTIQEFQCASLGYLDLRDNKLHGPIPVSVFQQKNLTYLDLSRNNLSGAVGLDQFSKLKNLYYLRLSFNHLSLSFNNFDNYTLPNLETLELSSCNMSEFPYFLRASEFLFRLDLSQNKIQGNIPKWLWNVGVDTLQDLNLSHNLLTGYVPEQLPWKYLYTIDLRSNMIQGHLPIPPPSTYYYFISNNQLFGEISSLICTLTSIEILDLSHNTLNGRIPLCLGNLSNYLSVLDLRMNVFDGTIPKTFLKGNYLTNIVLNGNRLKGPLPRALLNCRNLEILDLGNNMINDTFPRWLESLPKLQVLILRSNMFHGSLGTPKVRFPFRELRIIDLSFNNFSGLLPTKYFEHFLAMMHNGWVNETKYMGEDLSFNTYYRDSMIVTMKGFEVHFEKILNIFTTIDFSKNNFDGEIPKSLGNLKSLKGLNLSHNKIFGNIPTSLGNLSNLEWLDLSSNYLSGEIPTQLTEITSLSTFNVSQNHLVGAIPPGKQFNTFRNDSYIGNLGLCGLPLTKKCGNDEAQQPSPSVNDDEEATNGFDWKYVFMGMGYASGLVIGISGGDMFFSDERLICLMRKVGGEHWVKLLKTRKRPNGRFSRRRRN